MARFTTWLGVLFAMLCVGSCGRTDFEFTHFGSHGTESTTIDTDTDTSTICGDLVCEGHEDCESCPGD